MLGVDLLTPFFLSKDLSTALNYNVVRIILRKLTTYFCMTFYEEKSSTCLVHVQYYNWMTY